MSRFAETAIRELIRPTVERSKARLHSPQPPASRRLPYVRPPVHRSDSARRSIIGTSDPAKRNLVRAIIRRHAIDPRTVKCRVTPIGTYAVPPTRRGTVRFVWIGPVLLRISNKKWQILDVIAPCRVQANHADRDLHPRQTMFAFASPTSTASSRAKTTLTSVRVDTNNTCFRRDSTDLEHASVTHFAPFTRLIYARCDDEGPFSKFVALIDRANTIHCSNCHKQFATTRALSEHVGLPPLTQFKTFIQ